MVDTNFAEEMEILKTRIMLNKLIKLNLELYNSIIQYAKENKVPLPLNLSILRLVQEIEKTDVETFLIKQTKSNSFRWDDKNARAKGARTLLMYFL